MLISILVLSLTIIGNGEMLEVFDFFGNGIKDNAALQFATLRFLNIQKKLVSAVRLKNGFLQMERAPTYQLYLDL